MKVLVVMTGTFLFMAMKTYWSKTTGDGEEFIEIRTEAKEVAIWGWQGHWKNESGNVVSFDSFLRGEIDGWIEKMHGKEVLVEVRSNVGLLTEKS